MAHFLAETIGAAAERTLRITMNLSRWYAEHFEKGSRGHNEFAHCGGIGSIGGGGCVVDGKAAISRGGGGSSKQGLLNMRAFDKFVASIQTHRQCFQQHCGAGTAGIGHNCVYVVIAAL